MRFRKNSFRFVLVVITAVVLVGCQSSVVEEKTEDNLTLLSWDDSSPVKYDESSDWTKFSFSLFSLRLPKNFRAINLSEDQNAVELVNYAMREDRVSDNNSLGNLKVVVAIASVGDQGNIEATTSPVMVAGVRGWRRTLDNGEEVVTVVSATHQKEFSFQFSEDFGKFDGLKEMILESVAFHSRGSL